MKSISAFGVIGLLLSATSAHSNSAPPSDPIFYLRYVCLYGEEDGVKVSNDKRAITCDEYGRREEAALEIGYCWNELKARYIRCESSTMLKRRAP